MALINSEKHRMYNEDSMTRVAPDTYLTHNKLGIESHGGDVTGRSG